MTAFQAGDLSNARSAAAITHAVSAVDLDADGRVISVCWGPVDPLKNAWGAARTTAPVAAVVDALAAGEPVFALFPSAHGHLPDRQFVIADYDGGRKTIVLHGPATHEREVHDMDRITPPGAAP